MKCATSLVVLLLLLGSLTIEAEGNAVRHGRLALHRVQRGAPSGAVGLITDPYRVTYFVNVTIGTPPSDPLSVVLDTGSGNLAVSGYGCSGCLGQHSYNPAGSSTAKPWRCTTNADCPCTEASHCVCDTTKGLCSFGIRYVDGSGWTANPTTDVVSIFNTQAKNTVAVIELSSGGGTFYDDNDGTMGWAYGGNLTVSGTGWFEDYARQTLAAPVFSICVGWTRGWLSIGSVDAELFQGPIVYTPIIKTGYYTVNFTNSAVLAANSSSAGGNGITANVPVYRDPLDTLGPLLDTGSTLMHLDPTTYESLMTAVNTMCEQHAFGWVGICDASARSGNNNWTLSECIRIDAAQLRQWPTLRFDFKAAPGSPASPNGLVSVELGPLEYMNPISRRSDKDKYWCRGFDMAPMHANINIGDPLFRAAFVVHDLAKMQIGFAKPNRKYCF